MFCSNPKTESTDLQILCVFDVTSNLTINIYYLLPTQFNGLVQFLSVAVNIQNWNHLKAILFTLTRNNYRVSDISDFINHMSLISSCV